MADFTPLEHNTPTDLEGVWLHSFYATHDEDGKIQALTDEAGHLLHNLRSDESVIINLRQRNEELRLELGRYMAEGHKLLATKGCKGKFSKWAAAAFGLERKTAFRYRKAWEQHEADEIRKLQMEDGADGNGTSVPISESAPVKPPKPLKFSCSGDGSEEVKNQILSLRKVGIDVDTILAAAVKTAFDAEAEKRKMPGNVPPAAPEVLEVA